MRYKIHQAIKGNFFADKLPREQYVCVAEAEAEDMNQVYVQSQNIDSSWLTNEGVKPSEGLKECRSTSVGDIIENCGKNEFYMVMMVGFDKIEF